MSGVRPESPEEVRMLAGEYVLGVLGSAERRALDRQAMLDPRLAHAIAGWERRLAPLLTAVSEVAPPDGLWARIEHAKSLAQSQPQGAQPPPRLTSVPSRDVRPRSEPAWLRPAAPRRVWPWKAATGASLALAAGLAAFVLMPSPAHPVNEPMAAARDVSLMAVLIQPESPVETRHDTTPQMASDTGTARLVEPSQDLTDLARTARPAPGFLAAVWPDGTVVLTAFAPVPVSAGKTLQLWMQPPDATAPTSLGVLASAGRQVILPTMPQAGTTLTVSVEPAGGSKTGAPSGRIVYAGTLQSVLR